MVPIEYPPAARLADRHYSRRTIGARGLLPPGRRLLLWLEDAGRTLSMRDALAMALDAAGIEHG